MLSEINIDLIVCNPSSPALKWDSLSGQLETALQCHRGLKARRESCSEEKVQEIWFSRACSFSFDSHIDSKDGLLDGYGPTCMKILNLFAWNTHVLEFRYSGIGKTKKEQCVFNWHFSKTVECFRLCIFQRRWERRWCPGLYILCVSHRPGLGAIFVTPPGRSY